MSINRFPALLQSYFLDRLMRQRNSSPATITAYRDTFRLLLRYLRDTKKCVPSEVTLDMLTAETILSFLHHLETSRANSIKTRNNRLAAIHSFMEYVSFEAPEYLGLVQRVKQIPFKKAETKTVNYLVAAEVDALLSVCDVNQWLGRRDRLMVALLYNTGFRVSELDPSNMQHLSSGRPNVALYGCGGKAVKNGSYPYGTPHNAILKTGFKNRVEPMRTTFLQTVEGNVLRGPE